MMTFPIKYHPGDVNVGADVLSRKTALISFLLAEGAWVDVFRDLDVQFQPFNDQVMLTTMAAWEPKLLVKVKDN